jgi:predicted metal-dependent phosphotriesterase family hydrolase
MILLAVGIRSFAHDLFVTLAMGKKLNHIGPDFLWWDRFLRRMQQHGVNQYVIKFIPNLALIIWILYTLI